MAKVDVVTSIVIDRSLDRVAAFSSNPDNVSLWYVNIKSVEWKTPRPAILGSQIAFVADFLGRRLAYTYEIVELTRGRMVMRTSEGPFPMETSYAWEEMGEASTRMTLRNRGEPSGFSGLMSPLMAKMMRRANEKDLALLKTLLEQDVDLEPEQ